MSSLSALSDPAIDITPAMSFEIQLNLSRHCIETEIKRVYNRAISSYFKAGKDRKSIEQTITFTRYALESIDFAKLRTQYPPLAGNTSLHVVLSMDNDIVTIFLDGRSITPIRQQVV